MFENRKRPSLVKSEEQHCTIISLILGFLTLKFLLLIDWLMWNLYITAFQRCPQHSCRKSLQPFLPLWICSSWDWCRGCELITHIVNVTGFSSESNSTDEFCSAHFSKGDLQHQTGFSTRCWRHTGVGALNKCSSFLSQSLHNKPLPEMLMQVLFLSYIWHRCGASYCSNYLYWLNLVKKWRKKITQEKKLSNIGPIFSK